MGWSQAFGVSGKAPVDFLLCRSEAVTLFGLATSCQGADKTYMAQMGFPRVLPHTLPSGHEPHFSQLQSLPELCWKRAGLWLHHSCGSSYSGPGPYAAFLVWLHPCVITMNLPSDLDPCLNPAVPWPALLPGWGGGTCPGWRSPALQPPWGPHHSAPSSPRPAAPQHWVSSV